MEHIDNIVFVDLDGVKTYIGRLKHVDKFLTLILDDCIEMKKVQINPKATKAIAKKIQGHVTMKYDKVTTLAVVDPSPTRHVLPPFKPRVENETCSLELIRGSVVELQKQIEGLQGQTKTS